MAMEFYSEPINFESVSQVTATNSVELGFRRWHLGEEYVYCYNAGASTLNVGRGVKLQTGASGYSVAVTFLTDVFAPTVGTVKHTDIPTANYGWIMVKGYQNVKGHANSTLTGDYVMLGCSTSGTFGLASYSAGGTMQVAAIALNINTASAGTIYAFIRTGF